MVRKPPTIQPVDAVQESLNMLLYGDSGVGKTVFAASSDDPTLIVATEQGTTSAARMGSKADVWPAPGWEDVEKALDWLEENPDHGYKWVVVDSLTEMQRHAMAWILRQAIAENKSRDPDIPAIQDWMKYYEIYKRFLNRFRNLSANVVFICTAARHEDEEGETVILPDIQGKGYQLAQLTCALMDVIGYVKTSVQKGEAGGEKIKRSILFSSRPPYIAKDRWNILGSWFTVTDGDKQVSTLDSLARKIDGVAEEPAAPKKRTATRRRTTRKAN